MTKNIRNFAFLTLILCLVCALAFTSCKKQPEDQPPAPQPKPPVEESVVRLSDSVLTLDINDTAALTVREGGSADQKWTSSNPDVATVDVNGVVTAIAEGNADVQVTTSFGKATCTVLVVNSFVAPVLTVDNDEVSVAVGEDYLLLPRLTYKGIDCTNKANFDCNLVDGETDGIVAVDKKDNGFLFTASKTGSTKYVVSVSYAGVLSSVVVGVSVVDRDILFDVTNLAPVVGGFAVKLSTYAIDGYLTAVAPNVNVEDKGQKVEGASVEYTSDNVDVAKVQDGQIVAVAAGTTKVRGTYKTGSFVIDVTVSKPLLEVNATNKTVEVGRLAPLAFDRPIEGELLSATIGNYQVGESVVDGKLALSRNKIEDMPVSRYGEGVILTVETSLLEYRAEVDLFTLVIKNKQDYMKMGALSKAAMKDNEKLYGGYFVFGDNITVNGSMSEFVDRNKTEFVGDGSQGFCGVIDGKGYVISGLTKTSDSGNAFVSVMHRDGVLKNLGFVNACFETDNGSFLVHTGAGTVSNVYVQYDKISGGSTEGYSGTFYNASLKISNVIVDVSETVVTGNGSYFKLMTDNRETQPKNFACLFGNNYTLQDVIDGKVTVESNQNFGDDADGQSYRAAFERKVFFGFEAFSSSEMFSDKESWNAEFWHFDVDSGKVSFGVKTYVEPETQYKTIDIAESQRVRVETDINNDGTLNANKVIDIDLAAIVGSDEYTLVSLNGVGAASNVVTADLFGYAYGNQTVAVVVQVDNVVYTINMPVLIVNKVIRNAEDYAAWVTIAIACENDGMTYGSHNYGGYFELGNNITSTSGSIAMVYADKDAWDGAGGFAGTFDGCGYVIDGLVASQTADHATFVGEMKPQAVLKNIGFINVEMSGTTFLTRTTNGTLQNIYVQYKKITVTEGQTLLARENAVVQNVFVDASTADIVSGSLFGILGSNHAVQNNYDIYGIVPEGFVSFVYNGTNGCNHGFASGQLLKANDEAWNAVLRFAESCQYWHVDVDAASVSFGKK